jgi:hypothetical protein
MAWFDRLKQGLSKTRSVITGEVYDPGKNWEMDWDDLEERLELFQQEWDSEMGTSLH